MKIIDFARKGNVVRFYLGANDLKEWYGDDWNDYPYDCNAGEVYERFVSGYTDISFAFDLLVLEPCDGAFNVSVSKDDMVARNVPCLIVVPKELADSTWDHSFARFVGADGVTRYYFGDKMDAQVEVSHDET